MSQTVPKIGEKGESIVVRKGYARNFLLPKNYVVYSTPLTRKKYAEDAAKIDFESRLKRNKLIQSRKRFKTIVLKIKRQRVNGNELHSPVDAKTICTQLWRQHTLWVTPELVFLPQNGITSFGTHQIPILLGESTDPGANSILNIEVVPR